MIRVHRMLAVGMLALGASTAGNAQVVISQVYGGGGSTGAVFDSDYVELFNTSNSTVDLSGWSVQYAAAAGTAWQVTQLGNVSIQPGQYLLVREAVGATGGAALPTPDVTGTIAMSATNAKIALVNSTTALSGACPIPNAAVQDFVGYGTANCFEGSAAVSALNATTAALRNTNGCTDTNSNSADFSTAAPAPRNSASALNVCGGGGGQTNPSGVGSANPASLNAGDTTLLRVTVTPGSNPASTGITVQGNLTTIGGSATQAFFDDGTNGDVTAGDSIFSFSTTVTAGTSAGAKSLPLTISDAEARTGNTSINLTITAPQTITAIHAIQGPGNASPLVGQVVDTQGIVTARASNGFFLQAADNEVDADPATSEGVFVFTSTTPPAAAAIGNRVQVTGTVVEYVPTADPFQPPLTEIGGSPTVALISTGNALPAPIPLTATFPNPNGDIHQLERLEGMRVTVVSLTVVAPTISGGVFQGVVTGVPRPFREPGLEAPELPPIGITAPLFDGNPERIRVDSDRQTGTVSVNVDVDAVITNLVGVLDYGFRTYTIAPDPNSLANISAGRAPAAVSTPLPYQFTVASYNMENFTNDATRISKAKLGICQYLKTPDILAVEEVLDKATLQALATAINNDAANCPSAPNYQVYLTDLPNSSQDIGFLVKTAAVTGVTPRVSGVVATQLGVDTLLKCPDGTDTVNFLNDRPPLALTATINAAIGGSFPVTVIVNHSRSLIDINSSVARNDCFINEGIRTREKRKQQAEELASFVQALQGESLVVVGDFNAFNFNDGYVDVMGTIMGTPSLDNETVVVGDGADLVNPDLINLITTKPAAERYSYSFSGNAQTLDHVLINQALAKNKVVTAVREEHARINADFAENPLYISNANSPIRLSDHDPAVIYVDAFDRIFMDGFQAD